MLVPFKLFLDKKKSKEATPDFHEEKLPEIKEPKKKSKKQPS